ncbi:LytR/AlgR family response regulator transcription factor [Larkinella soli]|uniref:LytR/AlgR family response regulator transcription factor n=1 Tax=Larkinella soli TaxID=1770527 RepID=UPI000FFB3C55|nr:response regulator transcription factor [Larkinella soli]
MKKILSCLIIEDEPPAQEVLEKFIRRLPFLSLAARCDTAVAAFQAMETHKPDLIFLDIRLPEMTGMQFLESFTALRPQVIMTTAYPNYAVESYNYDVTDYLLKPISFERFVRAVNKVREKFALERGHPPARRAAGGAGAEARPGAAPRDYENYFLVRENKKLVKIMCSEIVFIEGMKDYVKIHTRERTVIPHMTLSRLEELLPKAHFLRINRSFIVSLTSIRNIDGNTIETHQGHKLPIGVSYREEVLNLFRSRVI